MTTQGATSNAVCQSQYDWMFNSLDQSPCLVAAYVCAACVGGTWNVPPLVTNSSGYEGPSTSEADGCICSGVAYNLFQGCSTCQGGAADTWDYWISVCPAALAVQGYPGQVPAGTVIPPWADLDPVVVGATGWDENAVYQYAVGPSAAITPGSTSVASTTSSPTSTPVSTSSTSSPTPTIAAAKSSSDIGPIVGGVVGGLGVVIIGALILWLLFRNRGGVQQQQQPAGLPVEGPNWTPGNPAAVKNYFPPAAAPPPQAAAPNPVGYRPYSAADSSTWAGSPQTHASSLPYTTPSTQNASGYDYHVYNPGSPQPYRMPSPPPLYPTPPAKN